MFDKKCKFRMRKSEIAPKILVSDWFSSAPQYWPLIGLSLVHVEEVVKCPVRVTVSSDGHLDQRLLGN